MRGFVWFIGFRVGGFRVEALWEGLDLDTFVPGVLGVDSLSTGFMTFSFGIGSAIVLFPEAGPVLIRALGKRRK